MIKGQLPPEAMLAIPQLGINIKTSIKYLGVEMENILPKEALVAPIAEAQRRADVVSSSVLSLSEMIQMLKVCILHVLLLMARA